MTRKSKRELEGAVDRLSGGGRLTLPAHLGDGDRPIEVDRKAFREWWKRQAAGPAPEGGR